MEWRWKPPECRASTKFVTASNWSPFPPITWSICNIYCKYEISSNYRRQKHIHMNYSSNSGKEICVMATRLLEEAFLWIQDGAKFNFFSSPANLSVMSAGHVISCIKHKVGHIMRGLLEQKSFLQIWVLVHNYVNIRKLAWSKCFITHNFVGQNCNIIHWSFRLRPASK